MPCQDRNLFFALRQRDHRSLNDDTAVAIARQIFDAAGNLHLTLPFCYAIIIELKFFKTLCGHIPAREKNYEMDIS